MRIKSHSLHRMCLPALSRIAAVASVSRRTMCPLVASISVACSIGSKAGARSQRCRRLSVLAETGGAVSTSPSVLNEPRGSPRLMPVTGTSGTSIHCERVNCVGNKRRKHTLFMAACTSLRANPDSQARNDRERLSARGAAPHVYVRPPRDRRSLRHRPRLLPRHLRPPQSRRTRRFMHRS